MKNHLINIFIIFAIICVEVDYCSVITKVTDAQMKKMGWTNYNLEDLNFCINKFEINTKERFCHFISVLSHESGLGRFAEDNRNCSIYEGRQDLGNIQPGDGCRFKGVGYIKLYGRYYYQQFSNFMGDENIMKGFSYVSPKYPFTCGGYFWNKNNINAFVDNSASIDRICKIVDGGIGTGCSNAVRKYYNKAKDIF